MYQKARPFIPTLNSTEFKYAIQFLPCKFLLPRCNHALVGKTGEAFAFYSCFTTEIALLEKDALDLSA